MAKVLFVNNLGGGFADYVEVAGNTTVDKFFSQQLPGRDAQDYLIRVNRQPVPRDYVLQDNDRVTMTPTKIEGAAALSPLSSAALASPMSASPC